MNPLSRFNGSRGFVCAGLLIMLFLSTSSFASRHRSLACPEPVAVETQASHSSYRLWIAVVVLGVAAFVLGRAFLGSEKARSESHVLFEKEMAKINRCLEEAVAAKKDADDRLSQFVITSQKEIQEESNRVNECKEMIASLESLLSEIRSVDPKIEEKAKEADERRKKAREAKEAAAAILAKKKEREDTGREQVWAALSEMKRGY